MSDVEMGQSAENDAIDPAAEFEALRRLGPKLSNAQWARMQELERTLDALGGTPGICRALNPERTFMCDLDAGHDGDHSGFELPTIEIAEGEPW